MPALRSSPLAASNSKPPKRMTEESRAEIAIRTPGGKIAQSYHPVNGWCDGIQVLEQMSPNASLFWDLDSHNNLRRLSLLTAAKLGYFLRATSVVAGLGTRWNMRRTMLMKTRVVLFILFLGVAVIMAGAAARSKSGQPGSGTRPANAKSRFRLSSKIFEDGATIPPSMIANTTVGSVCDGLNQSPELSWTDAPEGTKSFVVTLYDKTAAVTHWGAYDIPPTIDKLDENAGRHATAEVPFGAQVVN